MIKARRFFVWFCFTQRFFFLSFESVGLERYSPRYKIDNSCCKKSSMTRVRRVEDFRTQSGLGPARWTLSMTFEFVFSIVSVRLSQWISDNMEIDWYFGTFSISIFLASNHRYNVLNICRFIASSFFSFVGKSKG